MGGHYEKDIYRQLIELMERCEKMEKEHSEKIKKLEEKYEREIYELKEQHTKEVEKLKSEIVSLKKENAELKAENQKLREDNERMKSILNNNSKNSSLPPSSDQKVRRANTYNSRQKSDRKAGGQPGHKGKTLTEDTVKKLLASGKCEYKIKNIGEKSEKYAVRYVIDLKIVPVIEEIRIYSDSKGKYNIPKEYNSKVIYGNMIKTIAVDLYGEGVVSNDRICEFINNLSGSILNISTGSIYKFCREFFEKSSGTMSGIHEILMNDDIVYTDATTVSNNGRQEYIRNQSTDTAVLYSPMEKKNLETLNKTGIIPGFTGTLVHDHESALYHFGTEHGECNVHLIRYNRKNTEETGNKWSEQMTKLLCDIQNKKRALLSEGISCFSDEELEIISKQYDDIISQGREENKNTKHKYAKKEENALLNRLVSYKHNHLLFAYNFNVDFSDNMSERDLRKCKNRQKMSGGFRKASGKEIFCTVLSIIETCKRNKKSVFDSIFTIFSGGVINF